MANTYAFFDPDNSVVRRMPDGIFIPWNAQDGHPANMSNQAALTWQDDGSPVPSVYVSPPATSDQIRIANLLADSDRQNFASNALNATPQQVKNYINNNVTDLATAKTMLIRIALMFLLEIRR